MSNRGRLILAIFLTLAGKVSAQTTPLQVQVYDYADLQPSALREFTTLTQEILINAGLSVQVEVCARRIQGSCAAQTANARRLVVRVVAGGAKRMSNVGRPPLGQSFADSEGGTYASIFVAPVKDQAAAANVPWVIVLAYAAAHEIGHLLLGDQAHTPRGLMKAHWDSNDYQAMNQNHFHFCVEQIRELTERYGASHRADQDTDAALTSPR